MNKLWDCPLQCGRRHKEGHPHLEAQPISDEERAREETPASGVSVNVVGAETPADLAAQVSAQTTGKGKPQFKTSAEKEAAEQQAKIIAMRPLARRVAIIPYSATAILTFDQRWKQKLIEDDLQALEEATLRAMLAWGIEFSGKWSSISALALVHADTASRIYNEIQKENKIKREKEESEALREAEGKKQ